MPRTARTPADAASIQSAERLLASEEPAQAAAILRSLAPHYRDNVEFLLLLARAEADSGRTGPALDHLAVAIRQAPDDPRLHYRRAMVLRREGRVPEAIESVDRALALDGSDPLALGNRADLLDMSGRHSEAMATLEPALAVDGPPHLAVAVAFARLSARFGRQAEAISALERTLSQASISPMNRAVGLFALAQLLDGVGEFDRAFEAAAGAHAIRRARFDPAVHTRQVDDAIAGWNRGALTGVHRAAARDPRPVLIVGMPRSGTSLVEQILASHPSFFGVGERAELTRIAYELSGRPAVASPLLADPSVLRRQSVERCAKRYLDMLRQSGGDAPVVSDKNPTNFLHLGLAWALLPEVRVIHCIRDPRDTGLSCYFHDFTGVLSFVHELGHIASYWRDYQRLMAHWRSVLDLPVLDVVYEDMVADQQGQTRRMLEFVGLPWDDACLRFEKTDRVTMTDSNRQVRKSMYKSSVARWKNYEKHLGPLIEGLGPIPERAA